MMIETENHDREEEKYGFAAGDRIVPTPLLQEWITQREEWQYLLYRHSYEALQKALQKPSSSPLLVSTPMRGNSISQIWIDEWVGDQSQEEGK